MSIIDRIIYLLEEKNIKPADLCRHIPIKENVFSTWKKRKTDPPAKYILQICDFLGISPYYLLSGKEAPESGEHLTPHERQFIEKFNRLETIDKGRILERMDMIYENYPNNSTSAPESAAPTASLDQKKNFA